MTGTITARVLLVLLALAAGTPALAQAQTQEGQAAGEEAEAGDTGEIDREKVEPLRERIRPVSGQLFVKRGRIELTPSTLISFKDAFFTKYVFGGSVTFHVMEELGIGLRGGYALNTVSGSSQICTTVCRPPTFDELNGRAPGQITLLGGLDLQWAPIYGKLALMAEQFLHFDMYAIAGPSVVQYMAPNPDSTPGSTAELAFGGTVGLGMRVMVNRWMTVRAEVRDLIYREIIGPRGPTTPQLHHTQHQILMEVGVSFFLPSFFVEG